jgi:hypothetical protein
LGRKKRIDEIKEEYHLNRSLERCEIIAHTYINPCEDRGKVLRALTNVLEGQVNEENYGELSKIVVKGAGKEPVLRIFQHFRNRRVLAALRKHINRYIDRDRIVIYLHKQSAYAGVYSICDPGESPLGEIVVEIYVDEPKSIALWLTRF